MQLLILEETNDFILVNKPSGLIVEKNPFEHPSVEDLVEMHLLTQKKKPFVGVVHRLDKLTSGIMIFAKKKSILKLLNQQFAQKRVRKTYLAVVSNKFEQQYGRLEHFLRKDQATKKAVVFDKEVSNAKKAILDFRVVSESDGVQLVSIVLHTGRFHQIRAQFAAVGHPIVGDEKYGSDIAFEQKSIALHASELTFFDPQTGQKRSIKAPIPTISVWQNLNL